MAQPAETYGTIATQLLLDRLSGRVAERRRIVVLPPDFVVRKSCGAAAPQPAGTEGCTAGSRPAGRSGSVPPAQDPMTSRNWLRSRQPTLQRQSPGPRRSSPPTATELTCGAAP